MGISSYLDLVVVLEVRKKCKLWHFIAARLRGKIFQEFPFNISLNVQKLRTLHEEKSALYEHFFKSCVIKGQSFQLQQRDEFCTKTILVT